MPWKTESVMTQRKRLIEVMLLEKRNVSAICRQLGISRKTAYKWLKRYEAHGLQGLIDASQCPHTQPNKTNEGIEKVVVHTHENYPYWGPYKLQQYLLNEQLLEQVPSPRTIGKILKRHGYQVIKGDLSSPATLRFERSRPNELWQMDFKGSFMTRLQRCFPLTILDDYSRFSIELQACKNEQGSTVKERLLEVFRVYGLPEQINVDNGNPWGASDLESYSSIHVWLMKLGVRLSHSSPYHPQTNGKDERFHRTLKLEVLHQRLYRNLEDIQEAFDAWRAIYNFKRPHQGIGNQVPAKRYAASSKHLPRNLLKPAYESDCIVRKVDAVSGLFSFKGNLYRAGKAFSGEYVALKETNESDVFAVYFMDTLIKKLHIVEKTG